MYRFLGGNFQRLRLGGRYRKIAKSLFNLGFEYYKSIHTLGVECIN
jgi:hypothetical protein